MTMTLTRCLVSPIQPSPPGASPAGCTSTFPGAAIQNINTDAGGIYTFSNLQEGVYQVEALHGSVGRASATPSGGAANDLMMFTILDDSDVETGNWTTPVLP